MAKTLLLLGTAALFTALAGTRSFGDEHYQHDDRGYFDEHHHHHDFIYYHHHRGYWERHNGARIFVRV